MFAQFSHARISYFTFTLLVWTTTGFGQAPKLLKESSEPASSLAVSSDGKTIAYTNKDHIIRLWDVETGKVTRQIKLNWSPPLYQTVCSVAFAPDGKTLSAACMNLTLVFSETTGELLKYEKHSSIQIRDSRTGALSRTIILGKSDVGAACLIAISHDGNILASSEYRTLKLRKVKTGKVLQILDGQHAWVTTIAFSQDGKTMATGSSEKAIIWDLETGKQLWSHTGSGRYPIAFAYSPIGNVFAVSDSSVLQIYDAKNRQETQTIKLQNNNYTNLIAFSLNGKKMVFCESDKFNAENLGEMTFWDVKKGKVTRSQSIRGQRGITSVFFFPDSKTMVSNSARFDGKPNTFKLWDLKPDKFAQKPK